MPGFRSRQKQLRLKWLKSTYHWACSIRSLHLSDNSLTRNSHPLITDFFFAALLMCVVITSLNFLHRGSLSITAAATQDVLWFMRLGLRVILAGILGTENTQSSKSCTFPGESLDPILSQLHPGDPVMIPKLTYPDASTSVIQFYVWTEYVQ